MKEKRAEVLAFRLTPEVAEVVREKARNARVSVSTWLRWQIEDLVAHDVGK